MAATASRKSSDILTERYQADVSDDVTEYLKLMAERELIRAR